MHIQESPDDESTGGIKKDDGIARIVKITDGESASSSSRNADSSQEGGSCDVVGNDGKRRVDQATPLQASITIKNVCDVSPEPDPSTKTWYSSDDNEVNIDMKLAELGNRSRTNNSSVIPVESTSSATTAEVQDTVNNHSTSTSECGQKEDATPTDFINMNKSPSKNSIDRRKSAMNSSGGKLSNSSGKLSSVVPVQRKKETSCIKRCIQEYTETGFSCLVKKKDTSSHWIKSDQADIFFAIWIVLNGIVLAFETDLRTEETDMDIGWFISDSIFTCVFLWEIGLRIREGPKTWFKDAWNVFDALLVTIGVIDAWILRSYYASANERANNGDDLRSLTLMRMFRLLRLVRILRLLRLFRFLRELVLLAKGILGSLRALIWTGLLLAIVLFMCGMLVTRVIGHSCCTEDDVFQDTRIRDDFFGTLPLSWFTLFQIMTLEGWPEIVRNVMEKMPLFAIFFVCFILFTNMAIFNLVTAIIVENVMDISREVQRDYLTKQEEERKQNIETFTNIFHQLDKDGDGCLSLEEIQEADEIAEYTLKNATANAVDSTDLFNILDVDGNGEISIDEFIQGAMTVSYPPQSKHILGMSYDVLKIDRKMDALITRVNAALKAVYPEGSFYIRSQKDASYGPLVTSNAFQDTIPPATAKEVAKITPNPKPNVSKKDLKVPFGICSSSSKKSGDDRHISDLTVTELKSIVAAEVRSEMQKCIGNEVQNVLCSFFAEHPDYGELTAHTKAKNINILAHNIQDV